MIKVRPAEESDREGIWNIFQAVIQGGDTYVYPIDTPREALSSLWFAPTMHTYVAENTAVTRNQGILGTYILKANHPGRGAHIANASYMVLPSVQGHGVGSVMAAHSLDEAKRLGFKGMQFNLVISTNEAAIHLWQKMGFQIIGTVPKAFNHKELGYVDAFIMYQSLTEETSS